MAQFIFTNIFMISLGTILYVAVRTLPRIEMSGEDKKGIMERWLASELPEKVDVAMNGFLVKFLRKLKILLLKVDNSLSGHLRKIRPENTGANAQKPAIDFKEISGKNKEDGNSVIDL
ncbi:MAG: hypothetical protein KGJ89_02535 [Patescibacteria group bacterium]|nr:hypothetical protein [Patescibacteria group bacterium]MDE2015755.1 hypothetical protein [Patescibacteria group bacterium]MDE2226812.1 hypothetical protein [Patescibacteria group bacterium]